MKILFLMLLTLGLMVVVCNSPRENQDLINSFTAPFKSNNVSNTYVIYYETPKTDKK